MLSLDSKRYQIPRKVAQGWKLVAENETRIIEDTFSYTFVSGLTLSGVGYEGKYTFIYDGDSVKPNARTLRIFGAEKLQPIVSVLANRKEREQEHSVNKENSSRFGSYSQWAAEFWDRYSNQWMSRDKALLKRTNFRDMGVWTRDAEAWFNEIYS